MKNIGLAGALASLPVSFALGQEPTPQADTDGRFAQVSKEILRKKPPRKISIPDVEGFKVLKGDFHIHTLYSDGLVMPKDRVTEAVDNGLDVISITDHIEYRPYLGGKSIQLVEKNDDHNIAYEITKPEAEKQNLILVRGTEITKRTMPPGHFNALFLEDANKVAAKVDDWREMLAVAAGQGAFVHWNHPGWIAPASGGLEKGVPMSFTDAHEEVRAKGHLHGVEVFNGTSFYPVALDWCNERDIVPIANSDVHQSEWNMYGHQNPLRPMTLILAKERTHDSVREAFFAGRTIGWAAGMVFGRQPWVEKLFRSSVEIKLEGGKLLLRNLGDIPCQFDLKEKTLELSPRGSLELPATEKLTVSNWLHGMQKSLKITVQGTVRE